MSTSIVLTREHIYPAVAVVSTFWISFWQAIRVGSARKASGIHYPQLYAEKADVAASVEANKFNCTQRAHQNTLEYIPTVAISTVITSVKHPLVAASLCGAWALFRVPYTIGYSTGDPARRNLLGSAVVGTVMWLGLLAASTWTLVELLRETL
ncbi:hypothetical protein IEO21_03077 [Rhodonia placenta]|uniref:Glutathione S-transferase n=1 Tax=Rhodonia placenta TaxID=104341 RepID=A0A8H7P6G7_9APHY|nr:hypothetical protein IEO21_03077 [Postia placenta]